MTKEERIQSLKWAFSPSSPIKKEEFFSGRISQLQKICDALNEEGQHAIVYGERGVGKTSLSNIIPIGIAALFGIASKTYLTVKIPFENRRAITYDPFFKSKL